MLKLNTTALILSLICCGSIAASQLPQLAGTVPDGVRIDAFDQSMTIMSSKNNNVLKWKSFNVSEDALLNFDQHNYLNLVTGGSPSVINGRIQGYGNVYIVNPAGITLGPKSSIQVPRLGLSSARINDDEILHFEQNGTLDFQSGKGMGRINLIGNIKADNLCVDGGQIVIKNATDLNTLSGDQLHNRNAERIKLTSSVKRIDIGHDATEDLKKDFGLSGEEFVSHSGQKAISTKEDLLNIQSNGSYFITNDIDLGEISSPLAGGNAFNGTIDGTYSRISYEGASDHVSGLFSGLSDAEINNLFINAKISVPTTGGADLAALATTIENSSLKDTEFNIVLNGKTDVAFNFGGVATYLKGNNYINNIIGTLTVSDPDLKLNFLTNAGSFCARNEGYLNTAGVNGITLKTALMGDELQKQTAVNFGSGFIAGVKDSFSLLDEDGKERFIVKDDRDDFFSVSNKGFYDPFFTENFSLDSDVRDPDYASLASNEAFDINKFTDIYADEEESSRGKFVFKLQNKEDDARRNFYFINIDEDGQESTGDSGRALVTTVVPDLKDPDPEPAPDPIPTPNPLPSPDPDLSDKKENSDDNYGKDYYASDISYSDRPKFTEVPKEQDLFSEILLKIPRLGNKIMLAMENANHELLAAVSYGLGHIASTTKDDEDIQKS